MSETSMNNDGPTVGKNSRVLILGGGFGGFYAAHHLDKTLAADPTVEVTLVSRENFLLFTPMLHEVAAGDLDFSDIVSPPRQILKHVVCLQAEVVRVDLTSGGSHWFTASIADRRRCFTTTWCSR